MQTNSQVKTDDPLHVNSSLNQKILYRAYDLILSWPLLETAVSNESKAIEPPPNQPQNTTQLGSE